MLASLSVIFVPPLLKLWRRGFNQVPADQATGWMNKTCKVQKRHHRHHKKRSSQRQVLRHWSERSHISQNNRCLLSLKDDEEETTCVRSDSLPSRRKQDIDDVKKLVIQLKRFDVFRVATTTSAPDEAEKTTDAHTQSGDIPLVSLANKNTAPNEVVSDLLTAEARGKGQVIINVKQRLLGFMMH